MKRLRERKSGEKLITKTAMMLEGLHHTFSLARKLKEGSDNNRIELINTALAQGLH